MLFFTRDFERKNIVQICGWQFPGSEKPYLFLKLPVGPDFKHLVIDFQSSSYEYNSVISPNFHCWWNYPKYTLCEENLVFVPRDFLNKNRTPALSVQSPVNRRQHKLHLFFHQVSFFYPNRRKRMKSIPMFTSFQYAALLKVDGLQHNSHFIVVFLFLCSMKIWNHCREQIIYSSILYDLYPQNAHLSLSVNIRVLDVGSTLSFSVVHPFSKYFLLAEFFPIDN